MNKSLALFVVSVALPVLSVPAFADDFYDGGASPSWTGFYFGVGAGYGHNNSELTVNDGGDRFSGHDTSSGGYLKMIYGYDQKISSKFVLGAFVDVSTSEFTRGNEDIHEGVVIDRSWAIGGRLGYLFDQQTMVYANAGYTQAHAYNEGGWAVDTGDDYFPGKGSAWFSGYFVGGGIERQLSSNFYVRGEARYSDFSSEKVNGGNIDGTQFSAREAPSIVTGEVALVYKLGQPQFLGGNGTTYNEYGGNQYGSGPRTISYFGIDAASDSVSYHSRADFGVTNDLYHSGVVVRVDGVIASYDYRSAWSGRRTDADDRSLSGMVGYQWVGTDWTAAGYVGYEVRTAHLSPFDLGNEVKGGTDGVKGLARLETNDTVPYYVSLEGSYSTAFDSYYAQGRFGFNQTSIVFGPEAAVYGDEGNNVTRVGAFATLPFQMWWLNVPAKLTFNAGAQLATGTADGSTREGGDGVYGGSVLRLDF